MPISYRIDPPARRVKVVVEGIVTLEEMRDAVDRIVKDPLFQRGFQVLSDHRTIGRSATPEEVKSLVQHIKHFRAELSQSRWGIVVSTDLSFGMMRMLAALAEEIPLRVEVFRDYDAAETWLHTDDAPTAR